MLQLLLVSGAEVVVTGRDETALNQLASAAQGRVYPFAADLNDEQNRQALYALCAAAGGIDILINNAGIQRRAPLEDFDANDWHELMRVNLDGVFHVSQAVARHMIGRGRGKIINICSVQSELARPTIAPYAASKGAVKMLTKGMCAEWARHGIRVNAIEPGYIDTEMTDAMWDTDHGKALIKRIPMRRLGKPEELNGLFLLFATEAGSWMTGACVPVDGGHLCSSL